MTGSLTGLVLLSALLQFLLAFAAPFLHARQRFVVSLVFPVSAAASLVALVAGGMAAGMGVTERFVLPMGLPGLPFTVRLDPLAGFFTVLVSALALCVSVYSVGYVRGLSRERPVTFLAFFYPLFIGGMQLVLLADDAFFFLIAWELMAAASYFLVLFEDGKASSRRAAFLYMLMAHIGAVGILLAFGIMAGAAAGFDTFQGYTFDAMRGAAVPPVWAGVAFLLAFLGFGAKAGVVPLHVWLPEAHPAAPSNVSALMSGAMLKTAVYGIVRFSFDLLHAPQLWWGELVLAAGLLSAIMGVLYAMMESDLKRLLAYSSVENIGIVLIGLGLAMIFHSFNTPLPAALALTAALYHALNHAMFKGLLFMGAGAVLHGAHERNMERMGGLIHKMKWTAPLFLAGALSISALPPFNGFVSEWLTFQAFLMSPTLPSRHLILIVPLGAALLALTGVLSATVFVKAFGMTFLGRYRGAHEGAVREATPSMRAGMLMAAAACLLLGVLPPLVIGWMEGLSLQLVGDSIARSAAGFGWLWLTPIAAARASYSGPMVLLGTVVVLVTVFLLLHARKAAIRRGAAWDCGFGKMTPRMQYGPAAFAMPQRTIFGYLFSVRETVKEELPDGRPEQYPARIKYALKVRDRFWAAFYLPVADAAFYLSRQTARLQHGRIHIYLLYSFVTIIFLLVFAL